MFFNSSSKVMLRQIFVQITLFSLKGYDQGGFCENNCLLCLNGYFQEGFVKITAKKEIKAKKREVFTRITDAVQKRMTKLRFIKDIF